MSIIFISFFSVFKFLKQKEKEKIINERKVLVEKILKTFLEKEYRGETFTFVYEKAKDVYTKPDFMFEISKKIKGKYRYYYKAYDSAGLEFEVSYEDSDYYEDINEGIEDNYYKILANKKLYYILETNINNIAKKDSIQYKLSDIIWDPFISNYEFSILIYETNPDKIETFLNEIDYFVWKEPMNLKNDNNHFSRMRSYQIYLLKDKEKFDELDSNFEELKKIYSADNIKAKKVESKKFDTFDKKEFASVIENDFSIYRSSSFDKTFTVVHIVTKN